MLPLTFFGHTTLRIVRDACTVVMSIALWLFGVPAFAQDKPLTNHLLKRAEAGHLQEQPRERARFKWAWAWIAISLKLRGGFTKQRIKEIQKLSVNSVFSIAWVPGCSAMTAKPSSGFSAPRYRTMPLPSLTLAFSCFRVGVPPRICSRRLTG